MHNSDTRDAIYSLDGNAMRDAFQTLADYLAHARHSLPHEHLLRRPSGRDVAVAAALQDRRQDLSLTAIGLYFLFGRLEISN